MGCFEAPYAHFELKPASVVYQARCRDKELEDVPLGWATRLPEGLREKIPELVGAVISTRPQVLQVVPSLIEALLALGKSEQEILAAVNGVVAAGDPFSGALSPAVPHRAAPGGLAPQSGGFGW